MTPTQPIAALREAMDVLQPGLVRAFGFSVGASLLLLAPSGYMLAVYDRVVSSRNPTTLLMLTLLVLGAFVLMEVLEWVRGQVLHEAGLLLDKRLSTRIFDAVFDASLQHLPGGGTQAMGDWKTLRDFLVSPALGAAMEAPVALLFLVLVLAIHPFLAGVALLGAGVQVGITWVNERRTQPGMLTANRMARAAQRYADSASRSVQVIEAMGMMSAVQRRWQQLQQALLDSQTQASGTAGAFQALSKLWQNVISSALLGLGCWLLLRSELSGGAGMVIIASILGGRVLAPLVVMVSQWQSFITLREAWQRLSQLLLQVPLKPDAMPLPAPRGALLVEQLSAGVPGGAGTILKGISFALQPGEVLAVVGHSAAGKTTLARLLTGVWPALSGKVRLDGVDVHAWRKAELGPYVGYLPQGVELFEGTVADNIARLGPTDPGKVEAAARRAGLHEFILGLPQAYQTPLGPDGAVLSGGQRQRVGLARALYGNPVLVVLDEPNASLDEAGDMALAQAIAQMKRQGTSFVVMTHRTSILSVADKMLLLREGQAQAFGPRDEVLAAIQKARAVSAGASGVPT